MLVDITRFLVDESPYTEFLCQLIDVEQITSVYLYKEFAGTAFKEFYIAISVGGLNRVVRLQPTIETVEYLSACMWDDELGNPLSPLITKLKEML